MADFHASIEISIGTQDVVLAVTFAYVPGTPARGPSYASGGEPADPPEVDLLTIEWSEKPQPWPAKHAFEWHKIERGPLFDLIANDDYVYGECCDAAERQIDERRWGVA